MKVTVIAGMAAVQERLSGQTPVAYKITDSTNTSNTTKEKFLSHNQTKAELTVYLSEKVLRHYDQTKTIVVAAEKNCTPNRLNVDHVKSSHEEADTKSFLHALDASARGASMLSIQSPDTVVFVLTIRSFPKLYNKTEFITGVGSTKRRIALLSVYEALGSENADALPGSFSRFFRRISNRSICTKRKAYMLEYFFLILVAITVDTLAALGKEAKPTPSMCKSLERFVCKLCNAQLST